MMIYIKKHGYRSPECDLPETKSRIKLCLQIWNCGVYQAVQWVCICFIFNYLNNSESVLQIAWSRKGFWHQATQMAVKSSYPGWKYNYIQVFFVKICPFDLNEHRTVSRKLSPNDHVFPGHNIQTFASVEKSLLVSEAVLKNR